MGGDEQASSDKPDLGPAHGPEELQARQERKRVTKKKREEGGRRQHPSPCGSLQDKRLRRTGASRRSALSVPVRALTSAMKKTWCLQTRSPLVVFAGLARGSAARR